MRAIKISGIIFLLFVTTLAQSDRVIRVRFPKGATSVELKGMLRGKRADVYLVRANKGQRMTVHLKVDEDQYASLQIRQPNGVTIDSENSADSGTDFENTLPMTGDYRLIVFPPETVDKTDTARYTLSISFDD